MPGLDTGNTGFMLLWLIDRVTAVRVTPGVEEIGLDAGLHHEEAYLEGSI